jgi:hypothetical protein
MPDDSFAERFKRLEPIDLITILNTADDYRPEAVDAARKELESRQLTVEQLSDVQNMYDERVNASQPKNEKWDRLKAKAEAVSHELSPVQFGPQSQENYIRSITVFAGAYFLFMLYKHTWFFESYFGDNALDMDWAVAEAAIPLVWLLIAGILFGLKQKAGWVLMFAYFAKVAIGSIVFLLYFGISYGVTQSLLTALIFGAAGYAMARANVREVFKVNKTVMANSIVLGTLTALAPFILLYIN